MWLWWLLLIINSLDSRIPWETGLWVCLAGIILIVFTGVGNSIFMLGATIPRAGDLGMFRTERGAVRPQAGFCSSLFLNYRCDVSSFLQPLPLRLALVINCGQNCELTKPFFSSCCCRLFYCSGRTVVLRSTAHKSVTLPSACSIRNCRERGPQTGTFNQFLGNADLCWKLRPGPLYLDSFTKTSQERES